MLISDSADNKSIAIKMLFFRLLRTGFNNIIRCNHEHLIREAMPNG